GRESRDFIYISDLIKAIDIVIKKSAFNGERVNIANGQQITIAEVADTFVKALHSTKKVLFNGAERKGDPINWEADITELKEWGYTQSVSIEQGVNRYIAWVENEKRLA
ncbi:MAG: hypothetical protein J5996_07390, partial [Prevotella sp.]|nr:hypothetical protein [Prevotella sp.]